MHTHYIHIYLGHIRDFQFHLEPDICKSHTLHRTSTRTHLAILCAHNSVCTYKSIYNWCVVNIAGWHKTQGCVGDIEDTYPMQGFCRTPMILWILSMATLSWKLLSPVKGRGEFYHEPHSLSWQPGPVCGADGFLWTMHVCEGAGDSPSLPPGSVGSHKALGLKAIPD